MRPPEAMLIFSAPQLYLPQVAYDSRENVVLLPQISFLSRIFFPLRPQLSSSFLQIVFHLFFFFVLAFLVVSHRKIGLRKDTLPKVEKILARICTFMNCIFPPGNKVENFLVHSF